MSNRNLLDELMVQAEQSACFRKIMQDGIVTDDEISELSAHVEELMKQVEATLSEKEFALVSKLITELNVLHAVTLSSNDF